MSSLAFKRVRAQAKLPVFATRLSAGADVYSALDELTYLAPGERRLIPTGIMAEIPAGYELQVRPRSGLALKKGLTVLNAPGTIDADYKLEIGVILINHGAEIVSIHPGDAIAQLVPAKIASELDIWTENEVGMPQRYDHIADVERVGGFGSTSK